MKLTNTRLMRYLFITLTLFINVSCVDDSFSQLVTNNTMLDEQVLLKPYALIIMEGQSNEGNNGNVGLESTGQTPYADMPSYLRTPSSNIYWMKPIASIPTRTAYTVNTSVGWGYLDQILYDLAPRYTEVLFTKYSIGGTTVLTAADGYGTYGSIGRSSMEVYGDYGIASADAVWGKGNYNVFIVAGHCESNGINSSDAAGLQPGMIEWLQEMRTNISDAVILYKQCGTYQDLDFSYILPDVVASQQGVVAALPRSFLINGGSNGKWELGDSIDDWSHYNKRGAITIGHAMSKKMFEVLRTTSVDNTAPSISSATISSGTPNQIVLTYSEALNRHVLPFWRDFSTTGSVSSNRKVTAITMTGSTVTLTFSENFYSGETVTLNYTKKQYYESCIQDFYGNEAVNLSGYSVTNSSSTTTPSSFTLVYSSNFSAGVDGWSFLSGGLVSSVDGIGGLDDVLECGSSDATPVVYKNSSFANTTQVHRVRFKMFVPVDFNTATPSNDYNIQITTAIGGIFVSNLYPYIRRNVLGGQWIDYEFSAIPSTAGALRFECSNITSGDKFWLRDVVIHRLVP